MPVCICGRKCQDYEEYVTHVRGGIPTIRRPRRVTSNYLEEERLRLLEYLDKHRLAEDEADSRKERVSV